MTVQFPLVSKLIAEFVGTFIFMATGIGVSLVFAGGEPEPAKLIGIALAHGFAIIAAVTAVGHISGGHLNPAVTIAMMVFRLKDPREGLAFIGAQFAGGIVATYAMMLGFDGRGSDLKAAVPALPEGGLEVGSGMFLEAIATFMLVWVVFAVGIDRDGAWFKVAAVPIGLAVSMGIFVIGPATGAAMNPVRWFGPALASGQWSNAMVWVFGPVAGAIIAGAVYIYGVKPRITA